MDVFQIQRLLVILLHLQQIVKLEIQLEQTSVAAYGPVD